VVGYSRQLIPANWKLLMENFRDPYHGALLHVSCPHSDCFRPDQNSELRMDETGRNGSLMSVPAHDPAVQSEAGDIERFVSAVGSMQLADRRLIEAVKELKGVRNGRNLLRFSERVHSSTDQLRFRSDMSFQRALTGLSSMWTHFGFENDDETMRQRRIRHGNLFGPAGLVSVDDNEIVVMAQNGSTRLKRTAKRS